jgi:hypothetical protein
MNRNIFILRDRSFFIFIISTPKPTEERERMRNRNGQGNRGEQGRRREGSKPLEDVLKTKIFLKLVSELLALLLRFHC